MSQPLEVLHVDNHVLAVVKPAGLPTVPDDSGDESLLDRARSWVEREYEKPGRAFLGVVHRLDRPVSGVLVFARTSKGAARLSDQWRRRAAHKTYLAVCEGVPPEASGRLEQWLLKDGARNRVAVRDARTADAGLAVTRWKVLERREGTTRIETLVEMVPETGKPHQLRLAAASWGCPLLGDLKYGASEPLSDRSIALHANALEIEHPTRAVPMRFEAQPPDTPWWVFG